MAALPQTPAVPYVLDGWNGVVAMAASASGSPRETEVVVVPRSGVDVRRAGIHARGTRRVLVVDDSPLMLSAALLGLRRAPDWDVATASSGRDGVELAASYRPDTILLDVVMPELDGPGTLRALREQTSTHDTPVVFLTADHADRDRLIELGAAGVIAKPFQPARLAQQMSEVLGWSS